MRSFFRSHAAMNRALEREVPVSHLDRLPLALALLLIFSLAFMQPPIPLLGYLAVPTDFIFLALGAAWVGLMLLKRRKLVWDPAYLFLTLYLLAMLVSVLESESPRASAVKLLTQLYLLSLPVIISDVISQEAELRSAIRAWLAGTALMAAVGILCLAAFAVDPNSPILQSALSVKGTLPPGDYPRLQMTFMNPNLACNYLTLSLVLLLAARKVGWIGTRSFPLLLAAILVASLTTISPGLGGIALAQGLWLWLLWRHRKAAAFSALALGSVTALLFLVAMAVTPIIHPTAPYLIHVPVLDVLFAPSGRLMIWTDAVRNFLAHPFTGRGIGIDPVSVHYMNPSGELETSTDAHNIFLSIAVQCGIVGLAAFLLLVWHIGRRTLPLRLDEGAPVTIRAALSIGLFVALVYEGLGGAFEDSRHLWVALGLLLASDRISHQAVQGRASP